MKQDRCTGQTAVTYATSSDYSIVHKQEVSLWRLHACMVTSIITSIDFLPSSDRLGYSSNVTAAQRQQRKWAPDKFVSVKPLSM